MVFYMDINTFSLSYFNGFNDLLSSNRKVEDRAVAFLKVISLVTVIIPLLVGLVYGVNRGIESLRGRVGKKIPSNNNTEGVDQARKTTLPTSEAQRSPRVISFSQTSEVPVLHSHHQRPLSARNDTPAAVGSQIALTDEEVTLTEAEFYQYFDRDHWTWTGQKNVRIKGDLKLWKYSTCHLIKSLPQNLTVEGDLDLRGFEALAALPDRLKVGGSFYLSHSKNLERLPEEFDVGKSLDIRECSALRAIPANLHVRGDLIIWQCPGLAALPVGLIVERKLEISECENMSLSPSSFRVDGELAIWECKNFTIFPEGFVIGGDVTIIECPNFTEIPDSILNLGLKTDGEKRAITCEGTGLKEQEIQRLQAGKYPGIEIEIS